MNRRRCEHTTYPVEVLPLDGGKKIAYCLGCGRTGPVCKSSREAVIALRKLPHWPSSREGAVFADRRRLSVPKYPYSSECVEGEFCEVHGSKQPLRRSGKHSTRAWWHPFGVETLRLGSSSCTIEYQGVATRNHATTREILVHRTGSQTNFAITEF